MRNQCFLYALKELGIRIIMLNLEIIYKEVRLATSQHVGTWLCLIIPIYRGADPGADPGNLQKGVGGGRYFTIFGGAENCTLKKSKYWPLNPLLDPQTL